MLSYRKTNISIDQEKVDKVLCSKTCATVDSKHDMIFSSFYLPYVPPPDAPIEDEAPPEVTNTKHRILWSDENIQPYRNLLQPTLSSLQENWHSPASSVSFSVLLQATNEALTSAAKATNKFVCLSEEKKLKKFTTPPDISLAAKEKLAAHKNWLSVSDTPSSSDLQKQTAKESFIVARTKHRRLCRRNDSLSAQLRDQRLDTILSGDPRAAFKELRQLKATKSEKIAELKVGDKVFQGDKVADGFFENILQLKTMKPETRNCSSCENARFDYKLVLEIAKSGEKIPPLNLEKAESLLYSLKPSVCDHYNISSLHYLHAGPEGVRHFQFLVNSAIENIELTTCEELNNAHAV